LKRWIRASCPAQREIGQKAWFLPGRAASISRHLRRRGTSLCLDTWSCRFMARGRRHPKGGKLALLSAPFVTDALTATLAGVAVERSVNLDAIPIARNSPSIAREAENADRRRLPWNLL
jgi:hypothetical protein